MRIIDQHNIENKNLSWEKNWKKVLPPEKYAFADKNSWFDWKSTRFVIDDDEKVRVDRKETNLLTSQLFYNLQQPNKKLHVDK